MAAAIGTRYVDVSDPSLSVVCPRCRLVAPRFSPYCSNCGCAFWPGRAAASAAFRIWQGADPARATARPYDLELPHPFVPEVVDFEARARRLGIHIFPSTRYPIFICIGFLFLGMAAVPTPTPLRLAAAIVGLVFFLFGVGGWWLFEDIKLYEERLEGPEEGH